MPERRFKIVHLDDEQSLGLFLVGHLRSLGYEAFYVPSKVEGVEWVKKYHPDLVISDIKSPEIDGIEFLKRLKSDPSTAHVPFIFLTAFADIKTAILGRNLGANDFISKPYDSVDLEKTIAQMVQESPCPALPNHPTNSLDFLDWPTLTGMFKGMIQRFARRSVKGH